MKRRVFLAERAKIAKHECLFAGACSENARKNKIPTQPAGACSENARKNSKICLAGRFLTKAPLRTLREVFFRPVQEPAGTVK
jgi:hypothetical protein